MGPGVEIETRFPLLLPRVLVDANQLELALLNLAVNARDAMPGGGSLVVAARIETVARATPEIEAGQYVCLSLTDSGEGMDQATLAKAAEPFFTTKGPGKGTGLGLAMVYGSVTQIGGRVVLKSETGRGTTAELWLPVVTDLTKPEPDPEPGLLRATDASLHVLAVDDDALVLMNTSAMLEELGHEVVEAGSAKQALEFFNRQPFDLVITDQAMPHMTGSQLAEAVRALRPDIPIIIATGYSELPHGAEGTFTKLSKPFNEHELERAISETVPATA